MVDWFPLDPLLDATIRHGSEQLPYSYGYAILVGWNIWKWEKQRKHGKRRDAKDREQDRRLDKLEGKNPMEFIASPNYTKGRLGRSIKKIVVHSMAGYMNPSIRDFQKTTREASAHYLIGHDGREVQMVEEKNAAWHCGARKLYWALYPFNNTDTIGIETEGGLIGNTTIPFGEAGRKVLSDRIAKIHREQGWGEPSRKTVVMHREMPGTATACPTGVDIDQVVADAKAAYNYREEAPQAPQPVPEVQPAVQRYFQPFKVNLDPSQEYRAEVRRVQEYLVARGYMTIAANEYGYYGKKTQAAIDKFQKDHGIKANKAYYGLWYDKTRAAANNKLTV